LGGLGSESAGQQQNKKNPSRTKNIWDVLLLNRRTWRTVLHGSVHNQAGPKKHVQGDERNMGWTELHERYLASCMHNIPPDKWEGVLFHYASSSSHSEPAPPAHHPLDIHYYSVADEPQLS
jgi:hypothetical protein